MLLTSFITLGFFFVELAGGILTGSLALLADSSHMAGDCLSLLVAWFASYLARRPRNIAKTYGYHRVEVLAALGNAMALWVISGFILANAIERFRRPPEVLISPMIIIAATGLIVNIICALILRRESKGNLNVKGAYLHVLSDMMGSLGAIIGGVTMKLTGSYWADPLVSGFICILLSISSLRLMINSLNILLEGVPGHLNVNEIRLELLAVSGVEDIHDLHVWSVGSGMDMLTGHITVNSQNQNQVDDILNQASRRLKEKFNIEHTTLQPEQKT
ncbi:MAG: cation transporter [Elusimicrobia bacterium]|nr:cation transporter [Elusimicrobiota bacterium]